MLLVYCQSVLRLSIGGLEYTENRINCTNICVQTAVVGLSVLQPASVDHVCMKLIILFFYPITEIGERCINIVHVYPLNPIKLQAEASLANFLVFK